MRDGQGDRMVRMENWVVGLRSENGSLPCQCACVLARVCLLFLLVCSGGSNLPLLLVSSAAALISLSTMRPCPKRTALTDCSHPVTRHLRLTALLKLLPFCFHFLSVVSVP